MALLLQNKLLKVLEDKRVYFESAYYDSPEEINPAIRSRCAEVFFEALTPSDIKKIVAMAAKKLNVDLTDKAKEIISSYTIEGRKAVDILCDAYGLAYYKEVF